GGRGSCRAAYRAGLCRRLGRSLALPVIAPECHSFLRLPKSMGTPAPRRLLTPASLHLFPFSSVNGPLRSPYDATGSPGPHNRCSLSSRLVVVAFRGVFHVNRSGREPPPRDGRFSSRFQASPGRFGMPAHRNPFSHLPP